MRHRHTERHRQQRDYSSLPRSLSQSLRDRCLSGNYSKAGHQTKGLLISHPPSLPRSATVYQVSHLRLINSVLNDLNELIIANKRKMTFSTNFSRLIKKAKLLQ